MKVKVRYGHGFKEVDVPATAFILRKKNMPCVENPLSEMRETLRNPIASLPLEEIARGKKDACIVVSDTTRPVPNRIILPPIIDLLKKAGIEKITILIANGTHDPVPDSLFEELLGRETLKYNPTIVNHSAYDDQMLVNLGIAAHGCPAIVNKVFMESDLKICTGLIEPHFMAGFSGGRKSICPGITGIETLKIFHGVEAMGHPLSKSCSLKGNPVDEIAKSVAKMAGCDFIVNVTLDEERRITGIFAGDLFKAHEEGCRFSEKESVVEIENAVDIVITSNGGYPLDQNYYQTAKGLVEAMDIVKPNGVIIISSECSLGLGKKAFVELLGELKEKGVRSFLADHSTPRTFKSDQWEVQKISQVLEKTRNIFLLSSLSDEEYSYTFAKKITSLDEGVERAKKIVGRTPSIAVIPEGPYVVSRIKRENSSRKERGK